MVPGFSYGNACCGNENVRMIQDQVFLKVQNPMRSPKVLFLLQKAELRKAVAPLESKKTLENSGGKLPKFTCPAQLVNLLRNRYRTLSAVQHVNKKQYVTTESIPKY